MTKDNDTINKMLQTKLALSPLDYLLGSWIFPSSLLYSLCTYYLLTWSSDFSFKHNHGEYENHKPCIKLAR